MVFAYEVKAYTISICPKKFRETANGFCIQYKVSRLSRALSLSRGWTNYL